MPIPEKEFLSFFGWNDFFQNQISNYNTSNLIPARIICEERNLYRLQINFNQTLWASVRGKLNFNTESRLDYPAVGDWVLVEIPAQSERGVIHYILDRRTILYRKQIGANADKQILSSNVDKVFITTSANQDLNYRRIERYLAVAYDSGAIPIILLTKTDTFNGDVSNLVYEISNYFIGVSTYALNYESFDSANFLFDLLKPNTTSVFIGSSGVGKSTLINYLIEDDKQTEKIKTQSIRENDGRGRHTTTSRNLYVSRFGGLVIDTPGMRELQLSDHAEGLQTQFVEIKNIIKNCKFNDCQHNTEPNCAIKNALDNGILSIDKWQNYLKLQAEVAFAQRKQNKLLAQQEKKTWKKLSIQVRHKSRFKRGDYE